MIISFSGTSGSGKSTVINEIKKSGILKGKKVLLREEDSFITIKFLKFLLGDSIFLRYKEEKYFKRKYNDILYKLFSAFTNTFYPMFVYIEFLAEYFLYQYIFKKTILLGDRFIYDYEVTFKNVLGIDNKYIGWFFDHTPRPYLSFLIDIDLDMASVKRNKNNIKGKITAGKNFHKNVLAHYHKIAKKHNLIIVNNKGNLKNVIKDINRYIKNKEKLVNLKRIAICGLDGTGKTTIAKKLKAYAYNLNIKSTIVHFYHENMIFKLLCFLGFFKVNEPEDAIFKKRRERSMKERSKTTPFILALLRFVDSYIQYIYSVIVNRNKLIIFDRFFYDYLVSFEYLKVRWRSLFNRFIPGIEQKFILASSPVTSYKRKPESVQAFYIECSKIYLRVAEEQKITIISNENKTPDIVVQELIDNIK